MTRATRISLRITVALFLITIAPMIVFFIGLGFNALSGCDIRDESGTVYGDCPAWQSDTISLMLMMPWLMLVTMPFVGVPTVIALIVTLALWIRSAVMRRSNK